MIATSGEPLVRFRPSVRRCRRGWPRTVEPGPEQQALVDHRAQRVRALPTAERRSAKPWDRSARTRALDAARVVHEGELYRRISVHFSALASRAGPAHGLGAVVQGDGAHTKTFFEAGATVDLFQFCAWMLLHGEPYAGYELLCELEKSRG
jgi:hypothetical protein